MCNGVLSGTHDENLKKNFMVTIDGHNYKSNIMVMENMIYNSFFFLARENSLKDKQNKHHEGKNSEAPQKRPEPKQVLNEDKVNHHTT